jgi:serine/threonine-protein kinase
VTFDIRETLPSERNVTFGRYVLGPLLGRGGMGEVFRAYDTRLEREVALKVLRASGEDEADAALLDEARSAAAINHGNVVLIFDVGRAAGLQYIAMELVAGPTLRAHIGNASVPIESRIQWIAQIASALAAAHDRGVLHRDVKPENVLVRGDGMVKVVDFGLARRAPAQRAPWLTPGAPSRDPQSGGNRKPVLVTSVGTPRYMSPEQLWGLPLDGRSDQFSWGVLAYELLSGTFPWRVDGDVCAAIVSATPAPLLGVPPAIAAAVTRTLAKAEKDRFASMRELVGVLRSSQ